MSSQAVGTKTTPLGKWEGPGGAIESSPCCHHQRAHYVLSWAQCLTRASATLRARQAGPELSPDSQSPAPAQPPPAAPLVMRPML